MTDAIDRIFAVSPDIRYVALYRNGALESHQRPGLENTSASESDKYEELLVNPTLLKCATQRGNLDCGGLRGLIETSWCASYRYAADTLLSALRTDPIL